MPSLRDFGPWATRSRERLASVGACLRGGSAAEQAIGSGFGRGVGWVHGQAILVFDESLAGTARKFQHSAEAEVSVAVKCVSCEGLAKRFFRAREILPRKVNIA